MNDMDFVKAFVSQREIIDEGIKRESCLVRALEDARRLYSKEDTLQEIVLRSQNQENNPERENQLMYQMGDIPFLSLVGYLILLDLIGEVFTKKGKGNNIENAINYFGTKNLRHCKCEVYALRNSLAHNYGLINIHPKPQKDADYSHKFMLSTESSNIGIFEKAGDWQRKDWSDKSETTSTKVNVPRLIEEIENLHKTLIQKVEDGDYAIGLQDGIEELKSRFTIRTNINNASNSV